MVDSKISNVLRRIRYYILELQEKSPLARAGVYYSGHDSSWINECTRYWLWEWEIYRTVPWFWFIYETLFLN